MRLTLPAGEQEPKTVRLHESNRQAHPVDRGIDEECAERSIFLPEGDEAFIGLGEAVDEYERMAGVLDGSRVELIDGYLVRKMPKKPPHIWAVMCLVETIPSLLPPGWTWRKEDPVRIPAFDEPEPDLAVLRGSAEA